MTELPALSFNSLLAELTNGDDRLTDPEFDPEQLVGDLRSKVDGLKQVESRMELIAQWFEDLSKPLLEKAKVIRKNRERLRDYITYSMRDNNFDTVPGDLWKLRLRPSGPSVQARRDPTVGDYVEMPDLVRVDTVYSWDKNAIKAKHAITAPEDMDGLPFSIKAGYWPEFVPNVPEVLEKKKRKKKNV